MARKGENPSDMRSESERVRSRGRGDPVEQEGSGRTVAPERALRERVVTTLRSEPEWSNADITVDVRGTCVWLTGSVDTINAKYQVEQSVKRVRGVESIVNDLSIRVGNALEEFSRNTDAARLREQLRRAPEATSGR